MMKEKETTAMANKVDALRPFEIAIEKEEAKRKELVNALKKENKILPSGPWDRLHAFGRWTPAGIAKMYKEVKDGTSELLEEDQKYLLEMCKDVESVHTAEDEKAE